MTKCKTILIAFMIVILLQTLLSVALNPFAQKIFIFAMTTATVYKFSYKLALL